MIEEYARHNGHADLLRESADGLTVEWRRRRSRRAEVLDKQVENHKTGHRGTVVGVLLPGAEDGAVAQSA